MFTDITIKSVTCCLWEEGTELRILDKNSWPNLRIFKTNLRTPEFQMKPVVLCVSI